VTALKETFAYKRVGDLPIRVDVYRDAALTERPLVVWIHGGALIMGNRESVPAWLLDACNESGFVLASIDYRLAPETKLSELVEDVQDAFNWLRDEAPRRVGTRSNPIAVIGESAGGYLALVAGLRVRPRLASVVSLWGYGDLIGDWYTQPSPHPCHHMVEPTAEEAYRQVSGPPISNDRERAGDGWIFYQFCRQRGVWPEAVSGWDPVRDVDRFTAFMPIANVTAEYPPTLLVHGELDTDVPHDRSEHMAAELAKCGVEHRLLSITGGEHGLDGAEPASIGGAFREATTFLRTHLLR
jgi:acetyl esterase/lipase